MIAFMRLVVTDPAYGDQVCFVPDIATGPDRFPVVDDFCKAGPSLVSAISLAKPPSIFHHHPPKIPPTGSRVDGFPFMVSTHEVANPTE